MSTATAEQIRNRPIFVKIPGTELEIECRRPDPMALITQGVLPLETFGAVLQLVNEAAAPNVILDNRQPETSTLTDADTKAYFRFVDIWACAAAVAPCLVLTEEEAAADPKLLCISELDQDVRNEIVRRTHRPLASPQLKAAVQSFRRDRPDGVGAGPDGQAVRDTAVEAAEHA